MRAGINLFSVRSLIGTERELFEAARRLGEMGYASLQFSGATYDPDVIARLVKEVGLPVTLTHVPYERIVNETDALMEEHARFSCRRIGLGMLPVPTLLNGEACKRAVGELQRAAERMKQNGFKFFYHHHHLEFFKHGDKTVFELLLEEAPDVHFTADTYWLQYGGADVLSFLDKLRGRAECVHLKDYQIVQDGESWMKPAFAPVGSGLLDIPAIVKKAREIGAEEFYVEQDDACAYPDPWRQVESSIRYLKGI